MRLARRLPQGLPWPSGGEAAAKERPIPGWLLESRHHFAYWRIQMPCAVKHQAALLLRRLGGHKPHVGSGDSLTDGLGISGVILLPFDIGFDVGRRHQPYRMTKCLQLARPMVRRGASFDADQAPRQHRPVGERHRG